MPRKRTRPQVLARLIAGRCAFCREDRPECLEAHRIVPGAEGGKYTEGNILSLCRNHHGLVTAGRIVIHGIRKATAHPLGVVHWTDEEQGEHFTPVPCQGVTGGKPQPEE